MSIIIALAMNSFALTSSVDPISDKSSHALSLVTDDFTLAFKCDEPGPSSIYAIYATTEYLGGGKNPKRPLTIRFGANEPFEGWWTYDRNSAVAFGDANMIALMSEAFSSQKVAIRAIKYDMSSVTNVSDYQADIDDAGMLLASCDPGLPSRVKNGK